MAKGLWCLPRTQSWLSQNKSVLSDALLWKSVRFSWQWPSPEVESLLPSSLQGTHLGEETHCVYIGVSIGGKDIHFSHKHHLRLTMSQAWARSRGIHPKWRSYYKELPVYWWKLATCEGSSFWNWFWRLGRSSVSRGVVRVEIKIGSEGKGMWVGVMSSQDLFSSASLCL